jgi:serine protease Do
MADEKFQKLLVASVLISLVVGGSAGALGGLFLPPILKNLPILQQYENQLMPDSGAIVQVEEESATIDTVKKVSPAVVSIVISKNLQNYLNLPNLDSGQAPVAEKRQVGGGTGFIVSADGLILTNKHVVIDETADYAVIFGDQTYPAKVVDKDYNNDLAVIKIEAKDLPVLELGDSNAIAIGQTVIAIGYTLGEYPNTVTKGVVSGINRQVSAGAAEMLSGLIQTDAAVNPGNSGGPLVDLTGKVIGINTAINPEGESIGFAIPINVAKKVVESVKKFGKIVRPFLGVRYYDLNEQNAKANNLPFTYGALVASGTGLTEPAVLANSPAAKAGLKENDVILEVNGQKLAKTTLALELQNFNPGDEISLKVWNNGKERMVKVTLEERKK